MRPPSAAALSLLSAQAVRERAHRLLALGLDGRLEHFRVDLDRIGDAADLAIEVTRGAYPRLDVPFHARWRHFVVGGDDRWQRLDRAAGWRDPAERARAAFDLATVSGRPASALLGDILVPSQSIAQTYEAYVVETTDGRTIDGVMGPQSPTFVTLRREKDQEDVIERDKIKNMYASNLSAMPSDLEKQVSVDEMGDLLAFIKER